MNGVKNQKIIQEKVMMKYLQGVNVTSVGEMVTSQEIVPTGEDQIQDDITIVNEDIEVVLEVIGAIIEEDIGLLGLQVEEAQEEVLEDIGEKVIVEEEVGVGVEVVIIESLEVEKVEANLMKVIIQEIVIINHGAKKVEVEIIVMVIVIIFLILKMKKIIIIMKKQII